MNKLHLLMMGILCGTMAKATEGAGASGGKGGGKPRAKPAAKPAEEEEEEEGEEEEEEGEEEEEEGEEEEGEEEEEGGDEEAAREAYKRERTKRRKLERDLADIQARLADGDEEGEEKPGKVAAKKQNAAEREAAKLRAELAELRAAAAREKSRGAIAAALAKAGAVAGADVLSILSAGLLAQLEPESDGTVDSFELNAHIKSLKKSAPALFEVVKKPSTSAPDSGKGKGGDAPPPARKGGKVTAKTRAADARARANGGKRV